MFSHPKQTIYVFCVFWSIHIITTTFTLSDSFDLKFWAGLQTYFLAQNGPFFCPFWPFFGFGWFHHIQRKNGFFLLKYPRDIDFSRSKSEIHILWMGCAQRGCQLHHHTLLKAELPDQENCADQTCFQWWNPMSLVIMCYQPSDAINRPEDAN